MRKMVIFVLVKCYSSSWCAVQYFLNGLHVWTEGAIYLLGDIKDFDSPVSHSTSLPLKLVDMMTTCISAQRRRGDHFTENQILPFWIADKDFFWESIHIISSNRGCRQFSLLYWIWNSEMIKDYEDILSENDTLSRAGLVSAQQELSSFSGFWALKCGVRVRSRLLWSSVLVTSEYLLILTKLKHAKYCHFCHKQIFLTAVFHRVWYRFVNVSDSSVPVSGCT